MAPSASGGQARGHLLPHRLRGRPQLCGRLPGQTGHPPLDIGHKIAKVAGVAKTYISVLSVLTTRSYLQKTSPQVTDHPSHHQFSGSFLCS